MKKAVLFDLDGTLWDSAVGVRDSWNNVFERNGIEPDLTVEKVHSLMGKQMDAIALILFPQMNDEKRAALMEECVVYENELLAQTGGILFDSLEEVLTNLADEYSLGIISNCQTGYIETFLSAHNLGKYFADFESFGATGKCKGENIAAVVKRGGFEKAIYVGDTQGDFDAAKMAGLIFVHAAYGFGSAPEAKFSIHSLDELIPLAKKLLNE